MNERAPLYAAAADQIVDIEDHRPAAIASEVIAAVAAVAAVAADPAADEASAG